MNLCVDWCAVNPKTNKFYKRPFCSTSTADSDWLSALAADGCTWYQALERTPYPSDEILVVIKRFIGDGYGDEKMSKFIR